MSKDKSKVIASVTVHLTDKGNYKVQVARGIEYKTMSGLSWPQVQIALNEIRTPLVLDQALHKNLDFPSAEEIAQRLAELLPYRKPPGDVGAVDQVAGRPWPTVDSCEARQPAYFHGDGQPLELRGFWITR